MTTQEDFEAFIKFCEQYRAKWGLFGWEVFYERCELSDCYARTIMNLRERTLRVQLNKGWLDGGHPVTKDELKQTARHEMIHAMLARLYTLSCTRWASSDELDDACEEAVRLVENALDSKPASVVMDGKD